LATFGHFGQAMLDPRNNEAQLGAVVFGPHERETKQLLFGELAQCPHIWFDAGCAAARIGHQGGDTFFRGRKNPNTLKWTYRQSQTLILLARRLRDS